MVPRCWWMVGVLLLWWKYYTVGVGVVAAVDGAFAAGGEEDVVQQTLLFAVDVDVDEVIELQ